MKEAFCEKLSLSNDNKVKLAIINDIITEYQKQGYTLTLRQLYYQLVSRDIIPNKQAEYAKLSNLLKKGRMAGIVDWNAIEDRTRVPDIPYWSDGVNDAIMDTARQFRRDRQEGQSKYVEVWCEKDALSGVLKRITHEYHIRLMINRGYSSCSAMYDAARRFKRAYYDGREGVILYLGDHDPSGLDMVRDISQRLEEFGIYIDVRHMALTPEQVDMYSPPPNPAKVTDPRADNYISRYGNTSWEVDALPPQTLTQIITDEIEATIDMGQYEYMLEIEQKEKETLLKIAESLE